MANVQLKNVRKVYENGHEAIKNASFDINDREFVILVGPSGCGKSTLLRMIAGLESISEGDLLIDGVRVNDKPAKDRDIAMVFQNYALYPHMTVYENMAFSLKLRNFPKDEIDKRVREASEMLGLNDYLDRKPKAMSGGQRQRVAVGRAIVRRPKVFLFDEPLSNLDAKLRVQMRVELVKLHRRLQSTMIYVTHCQVEAMTMGDKIVVVNRGDIQQVASPIELYRNPINKFVAGFIGSPAMNFCECDATIDASGVVLDGGSFRVRVPTERAKVLMASRPSKLILGIRPEFISDVRTIQAPADSIIEGVVDVVETMGNEIFIQISTGKHELTARLEPELDYRIGEKYRFALDLNKAHFFDPATEASLLYSPHER